MIVKQHADHRDDREHRKRSGRSLVPIEQPAAECDETRRSQSQTDDAKWTVREPAMPLEITGGASGRRDDVDIRSVRSENERGCCADSGPPERRARERQAEQRVGEIVHDVGRLPAIIPAR